MRIIADHSRGAVNLIADGVVPSNEDRGYVLRRVMRRAIQQGRVLGLDPPFLGRFAERVIELMGGAYPHLEAERESIMRWVGDEEESFGRTLDRGTELLAKLVAEAKAANTSWIDAADAFQLHDTYGFPYDLTKELLAEQGLSVDDDGFEALMDEQRERARARRRRAGRRPPRAGDRVRVEGAADDLRRLLRAQRADERRRRRADRRRRGAAGEARGEPVLRRGRRPGRRLRRDRGQRRRGAGRGRLPGRRRPGAPGRGGRLAGGQRRPGERGRRSRAPPRDDAQPHRDPPAARGPARARSALTCARRARRCVPTSCASTSPTGRRSTPTEVRSIEDRVNGWVKASRPVRALEMERAEAEAMGAMALFGEKYGDWVRVVEVDEVSRELCGGTHVANTAEVGIVAIVSEGSSAANVRRIEALTGPAAIDYYRERSDQLERDRRAARLGAATPSPRPGARPSGWPSSRRGSPSSVARRPAPRPSELGRGRRGWSAGSRSWSRARERRPGRPARPRRPDQAARGRRRGGARRRRRRQGGAGRELQPERGRARRLGGRRRSARRRRSSAAAEGDDPRSPRPAGARRRSSTTRWRPLARRLARALS